MNVKKICILFCISMLLSISIVSAATAENSNVNVSGTSITIGSYKINIDLSGTTPYFSITRNNTVRIRFVDALHKIYGKIAADTDSVFFGSESPHPVKLQTNGTTKLTIGVNGKLTATSLTGFDTGNLCYNIAGDIIPCTTLIPKIYHLTICKNITYGTECFSDYEHDNNNLYILWKVENGVGCCNGYNCNFGNFKNACLIPKNKLYSINFDGKYLNTSISNFSDYHYSCNYDTPWNWYPIYNVSNGNHNITIQQFKNCTDASVVDIKTISVNVVPQVNGTHYLVNWNG